MTKPVVGLTQWGAATTGSTADLDANFTTVKNAINDLNTYPNYLTDTGSAGALVATLAANLTGALTDGLKLTVKVAATNGGAATFNYNAGGALNILNLALTALQGGEMPGGSDVDLVYSSGQTAWILQTPYGAAIPGGFGGRNRLINATFNNDQRNNGNAAVVADDNYGPDRWNILTQNSNCNVSILTLQENGTPRNIRLTQTGASASRLGLEQIVESVNCIDLRGANAVLSGRVRLSSAANVRYAIIEHTGTADSVVSDYVNNWNDSTYAAGNFFISANTTITAVGVTTMSAATWANLTPLTGNVSGNMTNLTAFLWIEANANQNVTLDVGRLQLEAGSSPTPQERVEFTVDFARCKRYLPAYNSSGAGYKGLCSGFHYDSTHSLYPYPFEVQPRTPPTGVTVSAANQFVDLDGAGGQHTCSTLGFNDASLQACTLVSAVASGLAAGDGGVLGSNSAVAQILFTGCEL